MGGEDEEQRGSTGVSLGMLTRSVYICSSLSLQPATLNNEDKVFRAAKPL